MAKDAARGWIVDQLILIGHYEAQMSHIDEKLNDLWNKLDTEVNDMEEMQKTTDTINALYEIGREVYEARREAEDQIFSAVPDADPTFFCQVKHSATAFVIAEENFHARGFDAESEKVMLKAASNLGKVVSIAFGFEPYGCLRCLSDRLNTPEPKEEDGYELAPAL